MESSHPGTLPHEHFSLKLLAAAVRSLEPTGPVSGTERPASVAFTLYTMPARPHPVGSLVLQRRHLEEGAFRAKTVYTLACGDGVECVTEAETICTADRLATPREWTVNSRQFDAQGREVGGTASSFSGTYDGASVRIRASGREVAAARVGPSLAWGWGLFEAVERLALRPEIPELDFALLDHFDQVKPGHRLRLRKKSRLRLGTAMAVEEETVELERGTVYRPHSVERGGTAVDCVVFEQTGRGILPIVYWCSADGLLLAVSSGLEGYVRQSGKPGND